jgi:hypothetical protein
MDLYLFRPAQFESLYNCTPWEQSKAQLPLESRQHFWLGACFLLMGVVMELLYIPCLMAIWKHRENPCYKIMLYVGVNDMLCLVRSP